MGNTNTKLMSLEEIAKHKPADITNLQPVIDRYIRNYNLFSKSDDGIFHWERNLLHIERAIKNLRTDVSTVSVVQCLYTIAAFGMSCDPMDEEVYLVPYKGELTISRQLGYFIKERQRNKQICDQEPPTTHLVYRGDVFEVENGKVKAHKPLFQSNEIVAAYCIVTLANGNKKHLTYRKSDWESWRSKSNVKPDTYGTWYEQVAEIGTGEVIVQPNAAFLRTKILKHALTDKGNGWGSPTKPPLGVEVYTSIFNDDAEETTTYEQTTIPADEVPAEFTEAEVIEPADTELPDLNYDF